MSYVYSKTSYSSNAAKSSSPSQAIGDSKKKTSLLKDNSWIRRNAVEDEAVDPDPNFGRVVLNKCRSSDVLDSAEPANSNASKTPITQSEALKKRFGGSQDDLTKGRGTVSKPTVQEEPKKKCTTTTTKSDTTAQTLINSSQSVSRAEDELFDTLLPTSMKNCHTSPDSAVIVTKRENVSVDRPKDYQNTSVTSPPEFNKSTTYKERSWANDNIFDSPVAKPTKTVYSTPERDDNIPISPSRSMLERDLCSYCRTPMNSDPKMVLEDMKINCHTTCFKCEVCSSDLGYLKAGESMWVYRRTIHCERCFEVTREKWHR